MCCPLVCVLSLRQQLVRRAITRTTGPGRRACRVQLADTTNALAQHRERLLLPPCLGASNEYGYSSRTSYTPPQSHVILMEDHNRARRCERRALWSVGSCG